MALMKAVILSMRLSNCLRSDSSHPCSSPSDSVQGPQLSCVFPDSECSEDLWAAIITRISSLTYRPNRTTDPILTTGNSYRKVPNGW